MFVHHADTPHSPHILYYTHVTYSHTTLSTPNLVSSRKLSRVGMGDHHHWEYCVVLGWLWFRG